MTPNPQRAPSLTNLFADVPTELAAELLQSLVERPGLRIERIVSHGHASPEGFWYDQAEHEWVAVLAGAAKLRLVDPDELLTLKPGDFVAIPAHRKHRVEWTTPDEPTIWLAVFFN